MIRRWRAGARQPFARREHALPRARFPCLVHRPDHQRRQDRRHHRERQRRAATGPGRRDQASSHPDTVARRRRKFLGWRSPRVREDVPMKRARTAKDPRNQAAASQRAIAATVAATGRAAARQVRARMRQIRAIVRAAVPGAVEHFGSTSPASGSTAGRWSGTRRSGSTSAFTRSRPRCCAPIASTSPVTERRRERSAFRSTSRCRRRS